MHRWIPLLLTGCTGLYGNGFDDGCLDGALDGAMWGGVDAALCYTANPEPGDPGVSIGTRYDQGYYDGYIQCFPSSYRDAFDFAEYWLDQDVGPCESVP